MKRILIACEFSGTVRQAFAARGWDAWSCDLLDTDVPGQHIKGDCLEAARSGGWDAMIAHPPCTYLTTSGNRWFYHPSDAGLPVEQRRPHPAYPYRRHHRSDAISFVLALWSMKIRHVAIENPIGVLSTVWRKPDQVIHPYQFGDDASKSTCLWLRGLPLLIPTSVVPPRITATGARRWGNQCDGSGASKLPPSPDRWKLRSKTFSGIAAAMADQWGSFIEQEGCRPCSQCGTSLDEDYPYAACRPCGEAPCHHGNKWSECDACYHESDIAYDASR